METRVPYFELRNFLFYLVPGSVVVLSVILFFNGSPLKFLGSTLSNPFLESIATVLLAYVAGQLIYPISHWLRRICASKSGFCEDDPAFQEKLRSLLRSKDDHHFYTEVVFRDRSFMRFSIAMVLPTICLTTAASWSLYSADVWFWWIVVVLGIASCGGLFYRFRHYEERYRSHVDR